MESEREYNPIVVLRSGDGYRYLMNTQCRLPKDKLVRDLQAQVIAELQWKEEFHNLRPDSFFATAHWIIEPVSLPAAPYLSPINACEEIVRHLDVGGADFTKRCSLISDRTLLKGVPETPIDVVSLLIVVSIPSLSFKRPAHLTSSILERWASKRQKLTLPATVAELRSLMDAPLRDDEKIPLSPSVLDELLQTTESDVQDRLTSEAASILFRSSETEDATKLHSIFFNAVFHPPPAQDGTEDAFHSFWDGNIRRPIEVLVPSGKSIRNSSEHTATRNLRPDFGYLLDSRCPFRGEEKGPRNLEDPKYELSQKLDWDYGSVPYLLGYYCRGTVLTLVAIMRPEGADGKPEVHDLVTLDLSTRRARIQNLLHLINLACLFEELVNLMPRREAEYIPMERDNCTLELTAQHVIKRYTCRNALQKVRHLQNIYQFLSSNQVPNTDSIYFTSGEMVILQPRGHREMPRTEKDVVNAIFCILKVLEAIHPTLFHRDIRWPNIIRRKDKPSQWFLIDWEDASQSPTEALKHFASSTHSPRIFQDGHGAEVDIWGVGHLIMDCGVLGLSCKLREFGTWMKETLPSIKEAQVKFSVDFKYE